MCDKFHRNQIIKDVILKFKEPEFSFAGKTARKSTGCACDQTTKKFHRSKSDKDTKIEAMMSL